MYYSFEFYLEAMAFLNEHMDEGARLASWPYGNFGQCSVFIPNQPQRSR